MTPASRGTSLRMSSSNRRMSPELPEIPGRMMKSNPSHRSNSAPWRTRMTRSPRARSSSASAFPALGRCAVPSSANSSQVFGSRSGCDRKSGDAGSAGPRARIPAAASSRLARAPASSWSSSSMASRSTARRCSRTSPLRSRGRRAGHGSPSRTAAAHCPPGAPQTRSPAALTADGWQTDGTRDGALLEGRARSSRAAASRSRPPRGARRPCRCVPR